MFHDIVPADPLSFHVGALFVILFLSASILLRSDHRIVQPHPIAGVFVDTQMIIFQIFSYYIPYITFDSFLRLFFLLHAKE